MTETNLLKIQTVHFGELSLPENQVLFFQEGLLGFSENKRYVFVEEPAYAPFFMMQSVDDPHLCFVVVDPLEFMTNYELDVKPSEISSLEIASLEAARVVVIIVVRDDPSQITANLQGPIIINPAKNLGKQVVLLTDRYHTKHYILQEAEQRQGDPAMKKEA